MGTRYECDVIGCEEHGSKAGATQGGRGPYAIPEGWYSIVLKRAEPDYQEIPVQKRRRRRRYARPRFVLICPKHPHPDIKPEPADEVHNALDDYDDMIAAEDMTDDLA